MKCNRWWSVVMTPAVGTSTKKHALGEAMPRALSPPPRPPHLTNPPTTHDHPTQKE